MARQPVPSAVPLPPVVRVAAVPEALPAVGARQGQRGTLRGTRRRRTVKVRQRLKLWCLLGYQVHPNSLSHLQKP